jgi:DNA-binding transcriptional ArsR family regulator
MEALDRRESSHVAHARARRPLPYGTPRDARAALSPIPGGRADDEVVALLKAIAHPLRLGIVARLCDGELHVGALARELAAPQPIVSQQLRILRALGIVAATRVHGFARYRVRDGAFRDLVRLARACARPIGPRTR